MLGRLAALAVCVSLAACAGLEPAGRNAGRSPQATPPRAAPASPPPAPALPPPAARAPAPATVTPTPAPALVVPPQAQPVAPPSAPVATAPPPRATPVTPPPAAAPTPSTPTRAPVLTPQTSGDDIVVPGQREQQVLPPNGDPRSNSERMEDIRSWDQCVTRVQAAYERDPMRPQLDSPEEYCSRSLGMSNRNAIPISRQERRR